MESHETFHGIPSHAMKICHGIPWKVIKLFHGIPWKIKKTYMTRQLSLPHERVNADMWRVRNQAETAENMTHIVSRNISSETHNVQNI